MLENNGCSSIKSFAKLTTMMIFTLFCLLTVAFTVVSKCPELRKPHTSDCNLFYKCIDLPNGEFAWIPAKCQDGLIFEPHFKICTLPNNLNDCSANVDRHDSTSNYNDDNFNKNLESTFTANENPNTYVSSLETSNDTPNISHTTENIIYHLVSNYKIDIAPNNATRSDTHLSLLNTLITKVLVKDNNEQNWFPLSNQMVTKLNDQIVNNKKHGDNCESLILQCLVNKQNSKYNEFSQNIDDNTSKKVISVTDSLGNRQYISVEKYNTIKNNLNLESLNIIDCTEGVRLPNKTDCRKYYVCNYGTNPTVRDYICPKYTAFNEATRHCDIKSHSICEKKMLGVTSRSSDLNNTFDLESEKICKTGGKLADSKSKRHYYLCEANNSKAGIKAIRIECPKYLIFCKLKNLCTTQEMCFN